MRATTTIATMQRTRAIPRASSWFDIVDHRRTERTGLVDPEGENEFGDTAEPGRADESSSIRYFVEQDEFRLPVGIGGSARVADPDRTVL